MLSQEQKHIVEKNHSLIYWYIHKNRLDFDEWYDLLAIELCMTAKHFDKERGSFSTYFKMRADNVVKKEYAKKNAQKRAHDFHYSLDEMNDSLKMCFEHEDTDALDELLRYDRDDIIKMKLAGYTQYEIASILNVNQSHVSRILANIKEEYMKGKE